jgi:hypothetical protein
VAIVGLSVASWTAREAIASETAELGLVLAGSVLDGPVEDAPGLLSDPWLGLALVLALAVVAGVALVLCDWLDVPVGAPADVAVAAGGGDWVLCAAGWDPAGVVIGIELSGVVLVVGAAVTCSVQCSTATGWWLSWDFRAGSAREPAPACCAVASEVLAPDGVTAPPEACRVIGACVDTFTCRLAVTSLASGL